MCKISIIIPVHNRINYLKECLDSVLAQTIHSKEIICVSDGAEGECLGLLKNYALKHNEIMLIQKKHEGAWAARNVGIETAKGEYICFMDSDDYYPNEGVLEYLYAKAKENNALVCGGNIINDYMDGRIEPRGHQYDTEGFKLTEDEPQIMGHTRYIYRTSFLKENKLRYYPFLRFEDPPFVLSTFIKAKMFYTVNLVVYCCRKYPRNKYYDYDVVCDILRGLRECYSIVYNTGLLYIYDMLLSSVSTNILKHSLFYLYKGDKTITNIVGEINHFQKMINGTEVAVPDHKTAQRLFDLTQKKIAQINNSEKVVIYGAGYVGKKIYSLKIVDKEKLLGFGVTSLEGIDIKFYDGFPINEIKEYRNIKDTLFIVATSKEKWKEMELTLNKIEIDNYIFIDDVEVNDYEWYLLI